ncbi:MAG TPA: hypothetical protein VLM40_13150, partial [Gemmata sp.]|nr:hypothetical protein [Gemmata sp.]
PWGHKMKGEKLVPLQIDNPPVMGPATGVHCSMADWSKFAMLHLAAARKKPRMLKNDSFVHLHEPADGFEYAGGWVIHGDDKVLTHDGTNTLWYCRIQIHPRDNVALLVAMNRGGDEAKAAAGAAIKVLNAYYLDYLRRR